jgi:hypothetical protein
MAKDLSDFAQRSASTQHFGGGGVSETVGPDGRDARPLRRSENRLTDDPQRSVGRMNAEKDAARSDTGTTKEIHAHRVTDVLRDWELG